MKKIALLSLLSILSLGAFAKQQTVMLEVPTMTCVTCPITVEKALQQVEGDKLAVVTFDDEKTTVEKLTEATKNAGYPSVVKQ